MISIGYNVQELTIIKSIIIIVYYAPILFHDSKVLLDWMTKLGYHQKIYTLITAYPRQDLSQHAQQTLEEVRIDHDIALIVEEIQKDDESW